MAILPIPVSRRAAKLALFNGGPGATGRSYSDHDLITEKDGTARRYLTRDGSLIKETP